MECGKSRPCPRSLFWCVSLAVSSSLTAVSKRVKGKIIWQERGSSFKNFAPSQEPQPSATEAAAHKLTWRQEGATPAARRTLFSHVVTVARGRLSLRRNHFSKSSSRLGVLFLWTLRPPSPPITHHPPKHTEQSYTHSQLGCFRPTSRFLFPTSKIIQSISSISSLLFLIF